jgi:hypothetical protein
VTRLALALAGAAFLAGCGGQTVTTTVTQTAALPTLPRALALQLADDADRVTAALGRNDSCAAQREAAKLRADTVAAINAHEVPGPYQELLLAHVQAVAGVISCTPPKPAPSRGHDHGRGHDKHGKGDKG